MKKFNVFGFGRSARRSKHSPRLASPSRRRAFESLENRWLLSGTATVVDMPTSVGIGAPVIFAVTTTDPTVAHSDYSVALKDSVTTQPSTAMTPTVLNTSHILKMVVHGLTGGGSGTPFSGEMDFLLLDDYAPVNIQHISTLANANFYNNLTIHRIISSFMFQGGDPLGTGSGGSGTNGAGTTTPLSDELNPNIRFTSNGLLALANSGPDTNDCQFFVTDGSQRGLDYGYTIIGKMISGSGIQADIAGVQTVAGNAGDDQNNTPSKPKFTVTIDSISVVADTKDALIMLQGSSATTNPVIVAVSVKGSSQDPQNVNVITDTVSPYERPAYIVSNQTLGNPLGQTFNTAMNTSITAPISVQTDPSLPALSLANPTTTLPVPSLSDSVDSSNTASITATVASNGQVTVQPATGFVGVAGIKVHLNYDSNWPYSRPDTQAFPVFIRPAAPTIQFGAGITNGGTTTLDNSSAAKALTFTVGGLLSTQATTVNVYADPTLTNPLGTLIGTASAPVGSSSITVTTDPKYGTLHPGSHTFIATQTSNYAATQIQFVPTGGTASTTPVSLAVPAGTLSSERSSTALTATVPLQITNRTVPAGSQPAANLPWSFQVNTNAAAGTTLYYNITPPAGVGDMSIDANGLVTWTNPIPAGSASFTVFLRDSTFTQVDQVIYNVTVAGATNPTWTITSTTVPGNSQPVVGKAWTYQITTNATGASLTYALGTSPPSGVSINSSSGLITWNTPAAAGAATIPVVVSQGSYQQTLNLAVSPWQITSRTIPTGSAPIASQTWTFPITANPPSGTTLTYSIVSPAPSNMSIDGSTGVITWTSPPPTATTFSVQASESSTYFDTVAFTVTPATTPWQVTTTTVAPANQPVIGKSWTFQIQTNATTALTYSLSSSAPSGASISTTGLITWPSPTAGTTTIPVVVTDNTNPADNFSLTVTPWQITNRTVPGASLPTAGQNWTFQVTTSAPSGATLGYSLGSPAPSTMSISSTGLVSWTSPTVGTTTFTVQAGFTGGTSDSVTYSVQVANPATYDNTDVGITLQSGDTSVLVHLTGAKLDTLEILGAGNRKIVSQPIGTTRSVTILGAASQTGTITIDLAGNLALSGGVRLWSGSGGQMTAIVKGANTANSFVVNGGQLTGNGAVTVGGLAVSLFGTKQIQLGGLAGDDAYKLNYSTIPVLVNDTGGFNTIDFSGVTTGGVTFNLGRDQGQTQWIDPWNTTVAIQGVIAGLIGTASSDTLVGGNAPVSILRSGTGNDVLVGGKYNSVLVGGGGDDLLYGGSGKNLLISGRGNCKLYGSGADNTLISGTTTFDAVDKALISLVNGGRSAAMVAAKQGSVWVAAHPKQTPPNSVFVATQAAASKNQLFAAYGKSWTCSGKNDVSSTLTGSPVLPPQITSIPLVKATAGSAYSYQVAASSTTAVTYSLSNPPANMSINAATGLITWPATNVQAGSVKVTVYAMNSTGTSSPQSFTLTVS